MPVPFVIILDDAYPILRLVLLRYYCPWLFFMSDYAIISQIVLGTQWADPYMAWCDFRR